MKGMNLLLCSSDASTAVTYSITGQRSMVRRSTKRHAASARSKSQRICVPCSSQLPINPKPHHKKSSADKKHMSDLLRRKSSVQINNVYGSSTRYLLLSDTPFIENWVSESDKVSTMDAVQPANKPNQDRVVVLRVSLHCKACEGKVRKHISKMEGVRSFSIDMEAKKVTIKGHVTPLGVLASVSKVKNAQLWSSST